MISILAEATQAASPLSEALKGLIAVVILLATAWVRSYVADLKDRTTKAEGDATAAHKLKETAIVGVEAAGVAMLDNLLAALPPDIKAAMGKAGAQKVADALSKATKGEIKAVAIEAGTQMALAAAVEAITKDGAVSKELAPAAKRATEPARPAFKDDGPFPPRLASAILLALTLCLAPGCLSASVHDLAVTQQTAVQHLRDSSEPDPAWLAAMTGKPDKAGVPWTEARLRAVWAEEWAALEASSAKIVEVSK